MKNKRQARLAKKAAKKAVVNEEQTAASNEQANTDKLSAKKNIQTQSDENDGSPKKLKNKSGTHSTKQETKSLDVTKRKVAAVKPNVYNPYSEEITLPDLQAYKISVMGSLSCPEVRRVAEKILAQNDFKLLPIDIDSAVMDIERMRYSFKRDPETRRSRYDPNGRDMDGKTPLFYAIKYNQKEAIKLLLENGADSATIDFYGDNALMTAVKTGESSAMNLVWQHRIRDALNVNHQNAMGMTALHLATERSWEGCVHFLLSNRASPNIKNSDGATPLMFSCMNGDKKIAEMLIKAGADIYKQDNSFYKAISSAVVHENVDLCNFLLTEITDDDRRCQFVKDLLDNIANPPTRDFMFEVFETNFLPLFDACFQHPEYRNSFYNEKVVQRMTVTMEDMQRDIDTVTSLAYVIVGTFFRFGDFIDKQFVKQFVRCRGPELVTHIIKFFTYEWGYEKKQTVLIFLPVIGLVEIPEGKSWIFDHATSVSEYFSGFDKEGLHKILVSSDLYEWCYEGKHYTEINRVWVQFYNLVNKALSQQREIQMAAILEKEAREIDKLAKTEDKTCIGESEYEGVINDEAVLSYEIEEQLSLFGHETECKNTNAIVGTPDKRNCKGQNDDDASMHPENLIHSAEGTDVDFEWIEEKKEEQDSWTTVHAKKHKEKQKFEKQPLAVHVKYAGAPREKFSQSNRQRMKKETKRKAIPLNAFSKPVTCPTPMVGTARWADVAKGSEKRQEIKIINYPKPEAEVELKSKNHVQTQSPRRQLDDLKTEQKVQQKETDRKPTKMTFFFHEEQPEDSDVGSIDIEMVEFELQKFEALNNKTIQPDVTVTKIPENTTQDTENSSQKTEPCLPSLTPSSECFTYDPEYVDETKPNHFDPTHLSDEEIKSLNFKGSDCKSDQSVSGSEKKCPVIFDEDENGADEFHTFIPNTRSCFSDASDDNWLGNVLKDDSFEKEPQEEKPKGHYIDLFGMKYWMQHDIEEHHNVPKQRFTEKHTPSKKQKKQMKKRSETSAKKQKQQKVSILKNNTTNQNCQAKNKSAEVSVSCILSTKSDTIISNKQSQDSIQTISLVSMTEESSSQNLSDQYSVREPGESSVVKTKKSTDEEVYENQLRTFAKFEALLEMYESEPFMDYPESLSPAFESWPDVIDALFETSAEIPESFEEDDYDDKRQKNLRNVIEIEQEDFYADSIQDYYTAFRRTQKENIIERGNYVKNLQCTENAACRPQNHSSEGETLTVTGDPNDLEITDPAIISCRKGIIHSASGSSFSSIYAKKMTQEYDRIHSQERATDTSENGMQRIHAHESRINIEHSQKVNIENIVPTKERSSLETATCNKSSVGSLSDIDDDDDFDLTIIDREALLQEPLRFVNGSSLPATNSEFGQGLLKTAYRLEQDEIYESDDEVWSPGDLDGEPLEDEHHRPSPKSETDDEFFFPSFHSDTFSTENKPEGISLYQTLQQVQLQQLHAYYSRFRQQVTDVNSIEHTWFIYWAQAAGMSRELMQQYLEGTVEPVVGNASSGSRSHEGLPTGNEDRHQSEYNPFQEAPRNPPLYHLPNPQFPHPGFPCPTPIHPYNMPNPNSYGGTAAPNQRAPIPLRPPIPPLMLLPYGFVRPLNQPPVHPDVIRNIKSQQAAMSSAVKTKIEEMMVSMFEAKARSVRWRDQLARIRGLSPERMLVLGKIIIPREDTDRMYITYHSTGPTVLGYLSDGTEVAVKIANSAFRPIYPEEKDRLLSMDSSQTFLSRYRAIEENLGMYYIATDLHEFTLPEYLKILQKDADVDQNIAKSKLVFQLMRAIAILHQQYLIVHAELRPENVVIDVDGNVKVAGYGLGRNVDRNVTHFIDYNDEDKCWLAPEVIINKQNVTFKQDIWVVGMLVYYILTGGKNPFGSQTREIIHNIVEKNYVMDYVSEEASHLLSMMLSVNKIDRPAISDALKHPLFWADEKKLRFVMIAGSDIVWEMRNVPTADAKKKEDSMFNILSLVPCNMQLLKWVQTIEPVILKEMRSFRQYKNNFLDLVIFTYNCCNHFETLSARVREVIDEPCRYFLTKFPTMFMTVYRAIRASNRRDKSCYKPFF